MKLELKLELDEGKPLALFSCLQLSRGPCRRRFRRPKTSLRRKWASTRIPDCRMSLEPYSDAE